MTRAEYDRYCEAAIAKLQAQMDADDAWHRAHPALRAENHRRDAEQDAVYRETYGLPDMNRIEAAKHIELAARKAA